MTDDPFPLLLTAVVVLIGLTVLWGVSVMRRNASIIDPVWGTGFAVVAWVVAGWSGISSSRGWWLVALTTIWGLRLSLYLLWRNWGEPEDYRYRAMREHHGPRFWWVSGLTVFLLQGVLLWVISLPLQIGLIADSSAPYSLLDVAGLALFLLGIVFEVVGDWQLATFRRHRTNESQVLDRGLWRYTRHPNYFGDCCVWWGLYLIAAAGGAWWTVFSPLLMTLLLLKVSGVALMEQTIAHRRPEYDAYRKRTSAFFPWPPGE